MKIECQITDKGKYVVRRKGDGSVVSQHSQEKEAQQSCNNAGPGDFIIERPDCEYSIRVSGDSAPPAEPPAEPDPPTEPAPPAGDNPFNALYPVGYRLMTLAADPIPSVTRPAKATSLANATIDPTYGTRVYRASDAANEGSKEQLRHDYSRRQAFNCDNTRYLQIDGNGSVYLYDAVTFAKLKTLNLAGGDSEPLWHPTDPAILRHTDYTGGSKWYELNVETGERTVLFDFTGKTPWPAATRFWTKAEGSFDRAGRYICLMAMDNAYGMLGVVCFDAVGKKVVGTLSVAQSGMPDHVSMSASGEWCVVSGAQTIAYTRDFTTSKVLYERSEHSDLGLDKDGRDVIVHAVFASGPDEGWIVSTDIETGAHTRVTRIYDDNHGSTTVHISAQCFDRPGWCVVSTYDDFSNYGTYPAKPLQPLHRKVSLHSMDGQQHYSVAHIHGDKSVGNAYYHEPQATISRDGSRLLFASAYGSPGQPEDYMVGLPDSVYG